MWLRDLLPEETPNARILTYGFNADTRSFTQTSTQNIFHHAEAFLVNLALMRRENPEVSKANRPLTSFNLSAVRDPLFSWLIVSVELY